ncbi:MAG: hypothetical protein ACOYD0_11810 [Candidatus Nanopelagicales bacterium]
MSKQRAWEDIKTEYESARDARRKELEEQMAVLRNELAELGGPQKRTGRRTKTCSVCVAKGLPGTGHTKRTHAAYMAQHPA